MKYLKSIGIFALTVISVMLVMEIYIRGARIESTLNTDIDPTIGRVRRANAQYIYYNEGMSIGEFNDYGYIGPTYHPEKPANTLRIALLGDSYTEGLYMAEERHFRSLLEAELQRQYPNKNVQVLNFGRSAFDLSDMYAYETNFVSRFQPDLVVYMINPFDLIQKEKDPLVPYWYLKGDSLQLNTEFRQGSELQTYQSIKGVLQNSALLQMMKNTYNLSKSDKASSIIFDKLVSEEKNEYNKLKDSYQLEDITQNEVSKKILQKLAERRDVVIVNRDEDPWSPQLSQWAGTEDTERFIDMSPLFARLDKEGHNPRYWKGTNQTGHWNVKTQEYVTSYLMQALEPILKRHQLSLTSRRAKKPNTAL